MTLLPQLAARVLGTPLLLHRAKLDVILCVLGPRIGLDTQGVLLAADGLPAEAAPSTTASGIAVLPIHGSLVKRSLGVQALSGLLSYDAIAAMLDAALADPAVSGILLDVDSPGGEVGGCFELAARIRQAARIKPIWALANDSAFSAAYALASAADRVLVTQTAGAGSIGVIALHVDQSGADAQQGLRYTPVFAGSHKNDFTPHAPLSAEAQTALQTEVDRLYDLFVAHVAAMRGLTESAVRATEAQVFFGPQAVDTGLADGVADLSEALIAFTAFLTSQGRSRSSARASAQANCAPDLETAPMQDQDPVPSAPQPAAVAAQPTDAAAAAAARADAQAIVELCTLAGMPDVAVSLLACGATADAARAFLLDAKAGTQSPEIVSAVDPAKTTAPKSNPVLQAARRLAGKE